MELFVRVCKAERMNVERLVARAFVVLGGLFWFVAALGAVTRYMEDGQAVLMDAWALFVVTVVVVALSMLYEVLTAVLLFIATIVFAVLAFTLPGIREAGVAGIWLLFTAAPALVSGVLFLLAARMQRVCEYQAEDSA